MIPLRPNRSASSLPPLAFGRPAGQAIPPRIHGGFLTRGLLVLAALALPALALRSAAITVRPGFGEAMQVAVVVAPPPAPMTATALRGGVR